MVTTQEILSILDNSADNGSAGFVSLGHPYSYLIDCRLNIFRGTGDKWAIAVERTSYNPRAGRILLDINYYGNCLSALDVQINANCGYNTYSPIDDESFNKTTNEEEAITPEAIAWIIKGTEVPLSHNKQDYLDIGIELEEGNTYKIPVEAAARLLITKYPHLFKATDEQLYQPLPASLRKILVLDEWYHKDFYLLPILELEDGHAEDLHKIMKGYKEQNEKEWNENRPSSYETWKQIAEVIVTEDQSRYRPTLKANTHWKQWPESGSL